MSSITPADRATLKRLVGASAYARGNVYAQRRAVTSREWQDDGGRVVGAIQGGAATPYITSVALTRSASHQLTSVEATCTCPVRFNCKHAVALLLADDDGVRPPADRRPADNPVGERAARPLRLVSSGGHPVAGSARSDDASGWEASLLGLLGRAMEVDEPRAAAVGLQFELVVPPAASRHAVGPRVRLRPVVPGQAGNWVRSGISWSNLDHFSYGRPRRAPAIDQIRLLKELLSLSRPERTLYSRAEEAVWLDAIDSRRVWDLLAETRTLGIPLVQAGGRPPRPVTVRSSQATVGIDVTRKRSGLDVRPRVSIDDDSVPLGACLLVGHPAHGIVWWGHPEGSPSGPPELSVASLAAPVADSLRAFLLGGVAISVPRRDKERFVRDTLPALRREVTVASSDQSVVLPEPPPPTLLLSLRHHGDHRTGLTWAWARRLGDAEWREDLRAAVDERYDDGGQQAILAGVCRAVRSLPDLLEATPFGERLAPTAELDGMQSVRLVNDLLPVLQQLPGVEVDHDGEVPDYRPADAPPAVAFDGSTSSSDDWFDLVVKVSVDGEEVPFAELFVAIAEGRSHLILPSGTYFSLDSEELRQLAELIAEARGLQDSVGDGVRLSRFQAGIWEDLARLGVITGQARDWEDSVRALTDATERIEHPVPSGLDATLRPYQHAGFNWLVFLYRHDLGGVLADDMGLGKTVQALALMCHTREQSLTDAPFLVVAPTSVIENWAAECRRFAPGLRTVTVTETVSRRGEKLAEMAARADVVVTSYSLFRLEYGDYDAIEWAGMFLDEAQFAKNRSSKTYQRARMLPVRFKVAMTGTPMENNLMELWSLLSITAPGLFPSPDRFAEHYRVPIERQADADRLAQLRRRIRPLMLRRTKEQVVADLPAKQEQVLELELDPRHRRVYQTHLQRERQKILGLLGDMGKNRFEVFRSLTLLRQVSLSASLIDPGYAGVPSTKLDALMRMVHDIVDDGHRVLVFSQFTRFLAAARDRLRAAGVELCYLDGKTRNRPDVISGFRTGTAPVFLISLKAGGFGLNLTEADYCILLDPWWNPATEAQAVDRVHRIGQTRNVMVYRLVAKDTIEEKVMALKARKAALFANVVDAGGFESGALTAEDIRALVT